MKTKNGKDDRLPGWYYDRDGFKSFEAFALEMFVETDSKAAIHPISSLKKDLK